MSEHIVGDIWIDGIGGLKVITVKDPDKVGCKACAFATHAGGACPGAVYDRHPCCAEDRTDKYNVYFRLICYVPEGKEPPLIFRPFGSSLFNNK